ncbi:deoxycytidine triphosphate deaminase [Candidatus Parcubacteria bacterium]|nr:deoxycytidine triphosphate deaminase [Candidatus Parcubacteria bacterium]
MALSDKRILEEMKRGDIVIEPFRKQNLATSSYDVTLGDHYFREQRPNHIHSIYNIYDKRQTDHVWGTTPHKAKIAREVLKDVKFDYIGIKPTDKIILLDPGETILAHTQEFIGGRNHITTMMKARSSMGRNFIEVCKCAGWGDVGYTNRWTMEITNNSSHYSIPLVVGRRIAQIIFFETGPILEKDYTKAGKYQNTTDIKEIKKNWNPLSMLPRLYADRDIKKKA